MDGKIKEEGGIFIMNSKKFRIWDKINKVMTTDVVINPLWATLFDRDNEYYLELIGKKNYGSNITTLEGKGWGEDVFVIQQWTGKLDSKGEEIYEGDILYYAHKFECGDLFEEHGEVFYDDETAAFLFDRISQFSWMDSNVIWDSLKIIGNIYETPSLAISKKTVDQINESVDNYKNGHVGPPIQL